jgi:signal transduction histidine kinase/DNA-binding response OmpR family regulator
VTALLRRYFSYPELATAEGTARARTFHRVALGFAAIVSPFLLLVAALEPATATRRFVSIGLVAAVILPLVALNRRGDTRLASRLLLLGLVAIVVRSALTSGGIATPNTYFLIVLVGLGGLLFTARGLIICAVLIVLLGLAMVLVGALDLLPPPAVQFTPLTTWLYATLCIGLSVLVHREVSGSIGRSLRRAEGEIEARRQTEQERERLVHDLGERVKELRLLHGTARLLQQGDATDRVLFEQLVERIPPAWQYPQICVARLTFGDLVVASPGWRETEWMQSVAFRTTVGTGTIDVAYLEARPAAAEGPFLAEERALLGSLAEMLVGHQELRRHREELEALVATRTRQMQEARDDAERANRAKGDFLATMSHEIRTPMNAILGYAQLLRRDPALAQSHRDRLDAILSSGDHLLTLINNVLDMSRIEAGRTSLVAAPFDLHALLNELRDMFAALLAAKSLDLTFDGVYSLPRFVNADAGRIRQVLINLVSNALKFTRHGGITIRAFCESTPRGHHITVAVKDTGAGISPANLQRVFDVFEQSAEGVRAGGAGLGLAISRELARLMGGDLAVSSQEGAGSTFTFSFDAGTAEGLDAAQARRVLRIEPATRHPRVLIADDQPDNLTIADEMLRAVGFETHLVMRGDEALAAVSQWHPELILMDLRMPGMNGVEAIRQLRSAGVATPVVAFTASGLDMLAREAVLAGAEEVVLKPCTESVLHETVGRVLQLQYLYEEPAAAVARLVEPVVRTPQEPQLLADVPQPLLRELLTAAIQARTVQVERLAEQVARHAPAGAERIRKLVREFRMDDLIALLRAASGQLTS